MVGGEEGIRTLVGLLPNGFQGTITSRKMTDFARRYYSLWRSNKAKHSLTKTSGLCFEILFDFDAFLTDELNKFFGCSF